MFDIKYEYSSVHVGRVKEVFHVYATKSCCGIEEVFDFQFNSSSAFLEDYDPYDYWDDVDTSQHVCIALTNPEKWLGHYKAAVLYLVENWNDGPVIFDALVLGGWKQFIPPHENHNTGNIISGWVWNSPSIVE